MRGSSFFKLLLVLLLPLVLLFSSTDAMAQTSGTIKGVTLDDGGLAIPGVLVTVSSPALIGGAQQQSSDGQGRFLFIKLPPGIYSIRAEMAGFGTIEYQAIQVLIGKTVPLTVEMTYQEAGGVMVVKDTPPAIDTEQTQRSTVMTKEFLDRVPTGRDYLQAVSAAPGVIGGGNASMAGGAGNENTYMIDGVNITDPVTGTFSLNFNFDAIEQLEVVTGAFDAEHPNNLGGIVNIVTQTGGNTLEFQSNIFYSNGNWAPKTDARFTADGVQLSPTDFDSQFSTYQVSGQVSGPIVRDKAWFLISYQSSRSLIANVGIDLPRDYEGHYLMTKLTAQPTAAHRFTVLAQTNPTTIDNTNQSDRFVRPEAQGRQIQGGIVTSVQWDWFISPEVFVETKGTIQKSYIETSGVPCTHDVKLGYHPCEPNEVDNSLDILTPGRLGSFNAYDSENYPFFQFDDRYRTSVSSKVSFLQRTVPFLPGTHDFKGGLEVNRLSTERTYGYAGNIYYVDLNEVIYDPGTYSNYYWIETTGALTYKQSGESYGAFVQDVYKPVDNLTLRVGVRYDRSVQRADTNDAVVNFGVWGPRLYTAWDPFGDDKTKISGGYGRFNAIGNLGVANDLNSAGFGTKLYLGEYFGEYANGSSQNYSLSPNENLNTVNDRLTAPHSDEFVVGAERQVIDDIVVATNFTAKFTRNQYVYDETNVIWDEDGFGFLGTSNGEVESLFRLRTPSVSRRDYYHTDVQARKNFSNRWLASVTYSYVVSKGTVLGGGGSALAVPSQADFSYGNLPTDIRHQVKAFGAYELPNDPWTTNIGVSLQYYSGQPLSRYYYGAGYGGSNILKSDIGTYTRLRPVYYASLQVSQDIDVRKGQFRVYGIFENAVNARSPVGVNGSYLYQQNRWVITSRQSPVEIQFGGEYRF